MVSQISIQYKKVPNRSILTIDGTLICTTTQSLSGSVSNGNKGVIYISQSSRTGASPANTVLELYSEWKPIYSWYQLSFRYNFQCW